MAKQLACNDLMKGCKFVAKAPNEQELLKQVASHAAQVHGVKEITPDLLAKVRSAMKEVPA
jgi:predicted small metal-binding protein